MGRVKSFIVEIREKRVKGAIDPATQPTPRDSVPEFSIGRF
jgi:hypothetical protein